MLARIYRASIEQLAAEDYSHSQIEAWVSLADDEAEFGARLGQSLTLIATLNGLPAGFISLKGADHIDMLYVAPGVARQGVGSFLLDAIEKIAGARGALRLSVDASDTASPFLNTISIWSNGVIPCRSMMNGSATQHCTVFFRPASRCRTPPRRTARCTDRFDHDPSNACFPRSALSVRHHPARWRADDGC